MISYENLFEKASLFNFELSNIYFNYLITNSNPNINEINAANFDVNIVVSKLNARKSWQISNLSSAFAEMFICGSSVAKEIVEGNEFNLNPEEFSYTDMITAIDRDINEGAAIQVAQNNQLAFYQSSQKAYAAQTVLNNDSLKYINACKSVKYAKTITDEHEQNNINCKIIKNYSDVLVQYNAVLVEMLDIIEV